MFQGKYELYFQSRRKNMTLGVVHYTQKILGPGSGWPATIDGIRGTLFF